MSKKKLFGGKTSAVASLLNIVGMAMAFAALYIIMVQVNYDLSYNKKIKDSDRIFLMTKPDWYTPGKWSASLSRPLCEAAINNVPGVESGGLCDMSYRMELSFSRDWSSDVCSSDLFHSLEGPWFRGCGREPGQA